jgi:hypothetical protein
MKRFTRLLAGLVLACMAMPAHAVLSASIKREVPVNIIAPYLKNTPIPTAAGPEDPAFDGLQIWIPSYTTNEIWRYDAVSNKPVAGTQSGPNPIKQSAGPRKFIFDGTYMWAFMLNGVTVFKYDTTGKLVSTVKLQGSSDQAAFDGEAIWASTSAGTLERIDVASSSVTNVFPGIPQGVVGVDGQSIWISAGEGLIHYTFDPKLGSLREVLPRIVGLSSATGTSGIAFDGEYLWVNSDMTDGKVYKVNVSTHELVATVNVATGNHGLAFDGQLMWVVCTGSDVVEKIDVKLNQVVGEIQMPALSYAHDIVFDGKFMWVSASGSTAGLVYKYFARF